MIILTPKSETTALDGSKVRGSTPEEQKMLVDMTRDIVMDEDYAVLKTTRPRQAAPTTEELLVDTDRTLAQVRTLTVDYGNKAGRIDVRAWREFQDTHIRVIPCPDHKIDPKNWVHKTVPLMPGEAAEGLQAAG